MSREQNKLRQHIDECLEEREHRERESEDEYLDYHDDLDLFEWSWQQEDYWKDACDGWEEEEEEWDDRETEKEKWDDSDYDDPWDEYTSDDDWLDWEVSLGEPSFAEFGGRRYPQGDVVNARNHLTGD